MKKILLGLGAILIVVAAIVVVRTLMFTPQPREVMARGTVIDIDADVVAEHLSQAVQFKTVSPQPPLPIAIEEFEGFIAWAEATYPEVHAELELTRVGGYTLLFKWQGSDRALKPILLTAHYDVVPVIPGTEGDWKQDPFAGSIVDGKVWGRGALDDKSAVIAEFEAVTALLKAGYSPTRTVYLSFGHDEELGGPNGATGVADFFESTGVQVAWSIDEGSFLLQGFFPGLDLPYASINVAEKGYLTLDLVAKGSGGHSSMPPSETAVGVVSTAIVKLQNAPVPAKLDGPGMQSFDTITRYSSFGQRMVFANKWIFGGILMSMLEEQSFSNAMIRTTTAPTMLSGSIKENVLPIEAIATVNFRLHPRDTVEGIIAYVEKTIDDPRIEIRTRREGTSASRVSSATSEGYKAIAATVGRVYGDAIIGPGMTVAGTDSKQYGRIADDAYRFNPMIVTPSDITGFHGTNESISVENMGSATAFYAELIKASATQ